MSGRRELVVLGAGGHAKVVIATARLAGWTVTAVYDDDERKHGLELAGAPVLDTLAAAEHAALPALLAVGDNADRARIAGECDLEWVTVSHPAAVVDSSCRIGPGSVLFAGVVVQPDCTIGPHAILNTACSLDHDCRVGSFTHLGPGCRVAGHVTIGDGALLGIGCAVLPGVSIADRAIVGAGAVVRRDVAAGVTVAGSPARPVG